MGGTISRLVLVLIVLLASFFPLSSLRDIRLPRRITKVLMTTAVPPLPIPPNVDVVTVCDERPHLHLVGGTSADSSKLALLLDPLLSPTSASCLVTNGKLGSSPALTLKRARARHIKAHGLLDRVDTVKLPGLAPWSSEDAEVAKHVLLDYERALDDASEILVLDGLVTPDLRKALLETIHGKEEFVDPAYWERGSFRDVARGGGEEEGGHLGWGLKPFAMEELMSFDEGEVGVNPSALTEFCSRLESYLSKRANGGRALTLTKLPYAVFGPEVASLGANAPTADDPEDCFGWHIDGDPALAPPSAFRDCFGGYGNREGRGKPRFVSALVYLNGRWDEEWLGGTEFLDPPTNKIYTTTVKPGRVVLLDSDITHRVTRPAPDAGRRPRYSLVVKLLLGYQDVVVAEEGPVRLVGEGVESERFGSAEMNT